MATHHYSYGSGSTGCLYDNQGVAPTEHEAIDAAMSPFHYAGDGEDDDIIRACEEEMAKALRSLSEYGIHYFRIKLRPYFGADYVEVVKQDGPMPDESEA